MVRNETGAADPHVPLGMKLLVQPNRVSCRRLGQAGQAASSKAPGRGLTTSSSDPLLSQRKLWLVLEVTKGFTLPSLGPGKLDCILAKGLSFFLLREPEFGNSVT